MAIFLFGCNPVCRAHVPEAAGCEDLINLKFPRATVTLAQPIPAGNFLAPDGENYAVPAFCRVHGVSRPTSDSSINFEVWMPENGWSGRYYQHGQGGSGGVISYADLAGFLLSGAAGAATDDGHVMPADRGLGWALKHPERVVDFGYRALKETTDHAKIVVQTYYGKAPHYSYFEGCSDGGRLALMAAQRFPDDWNGILVGAPGNYRVRFTAGVNAWFGQIWLNNPAGRIPPSKLPAIQRAALAACKPQANVVDGIATDPRFCRLDPAILTCKTKDTDECLTEPQVAMVRTIYDGPRSLRTGEQIYPGYPSTVEGVNGGWDNNITGGRASMGFQSSANNAINEPSYSIRAKQFYRNFVFDDPQWDFQKLDLDRDIAYAENKLVAGQSLASILNSDNPELSGVNEKIPKILMYFGWADDSVTPLGGIKYYEDVAQKNNGFKKTQGFFRLFMAPGMAHCGGGPGPNSFGQFGRLYTPPLKDDAAHSITRALEAWVEKGVAPRKIIAAKYVDDKPERGALMTRPLCPYPQIAKYKGRGSTRDAGNFECVEGALSGSERD